MPYCTNAEHTQCNGYRGDLDTYFCHKPCMLHNWEKPVHTVSSNDNNEGDNND